MLRFDEIVLQGLALSIACVGARPILKLAGFLSLSLSCYFAIGSYTFIIVCNRSTNSEYLSVVQISIAAFCAILAAALTSLPNILALKFAMPPERFGLFSLAYGFGLWTLLINSNRFAETPDGISLVAKADPKLAIIVVLSFAGTLLLIEAWAEATAIGESLAWVKNGIADQSMFKIDSSSNLAFAELLAAVAAGASGACYGLIFNNADREWGDPRYLLYILVGTLLSLDRTEVTTRIEASTRILSSLLRPATILATSIFVVTLQPVAKTYLPPSWAPLDLVVFGLVLFLYSARHRISSYFPLRWRPQP